MAGNTIYDIAKKAGVSIATVSRVINNHDGIADKTRQKVLEVAEELGYHPQAYAQGLARKRKNSIMLVVPLLSNYFFMEVLGGIQDEIAKHPYDLNIFNVRQDGGSLFSQIENIIKRQLADGYIFISVHLGDKHLNRLQRYKVPIVLVDEPGNHFDTVLADNQEGVEKAMLYFLEQGMEKIAMISALKTSLPARQRIEGYKKALDEAGVGIREDLIVTGESMYRDGFSEQNGYEAMKKLFDLNERPEACFCSSDIQAVGALKAMREERTHIPIIGYDDITISKYIGLSTIRQPMYDMGMHGIRKLVDRIENMDKDPSKKIFAPALVLRESTERDYFHFSVES